MRHVVILQRDLLHYRRPFFTELDERLRASDIRLSVTYGHTDMDDASDLDWAVHRPHRTVLLPVGRALWQPTLDLVRGADLVVAEQASQLLINYLLLGWQALGGPPLAFWGHGKNFQATRSNALAERVKRQVSTQVHWWFAYNDLSRRVVEELGFPPERITSVQNAVDTSQLKRLAADVTEADRHRVRQRYGIVGDEVGIFCGRMYDLKRLPFLLDTARRIRALRPAFELILIGSGPDEALARDAAAAHGWIQWVGPMFGREKVELFSLGHVFLMPGLVGLAVLDAFALGTPMITTSVNYHSPEIDYLDSGVNGVMTEDDPDAYAEAVARLLADPSERERIAGNASASGDYYTTERMAANFCGGILRALEPT